MSHRVPPRPLVHPTNPRAAQHVVQRLAEVQSPPYLPPPSPQSPCPEHQCPGPEPVGNPRLPGSGDTSQDPLVLLLVSVPKGVSCPILSPSPGSRGGLAPGRSPAPTSGPRPRVLDSQEFLFYKRGLQCWCLERGWGECLRLRNWPGQQIPTFNVSCALCFGETCHRWGALRRGVSPVCRACCLTVWPSPRPLLPFCAPSRALSAPLILGLAADWGCAGPASPRCCSRK